jgi:uncharacterized protein
VRSQPVPVSSPLSHQSRDDQFGSCRVLSLDGGGTKGFQTLGVLHEIEAMAGVPLCQRFRLIYGTSTGACTAAFLALGARVEEIVDFYREHIPPVLRERTPAAKSAALDDFCRAAFGRQNFSAFRTHVGIICTDWRREAPVVLKTSSSPPGLGCTIARAVRASTSAYPIFNATRVRLQGQGTMDLVDGSYCANNPVVFAIAEALTNLGYPQSCLRVVSIGAGTYRKPVYRGLRRLIQLIKGVGVLQKTFGINTESMEQLRRDLFPNVAAVRINDHFGQHRMAVDFIESDVRKFDLLFDRGRMSFARHKTELQSLLA